MDSSAINVFRARVIALLRLLLTAYTSIKKQGHPFFFIISTYDLVLVTLIRAIIQKALCTVKDYDSSSSPVADAPYVPGTQCQLMTLSYFGNAVSDTPNVRFQCPACPVSEAGRRLFSLACLLVSDDPSSLPTQDSPLLDSLNPLALAALDFRRTVPVVSADGLPPGTRPEDRNAFIRRFIEV